MELKRYQKDVISDLRSYLTQLQNAGSVAEAYNLHWNSKDVRVGLNGVPVYNNTIVDVPDVCFKVPTGGGKTFLACNSIKHIFDALSPRKAKVVVWLVPSESILSQTMKALRDPHHPYRQKINTDFGSRVEVYEKSQLLAGQNFNPTSVNEQLSILLLSYDSFRATNKEGRKVHQDNGNLAQFSLVSETDFETTLAKVIAHYRPLLIVDESHHAQTKLSREMQEDINPCFILDLTATPKSNSNVISYVDAMELKRENMVKLPVMALNRDSQEDVIQDAISLRNRLEQMSIEEQKITGKYIRPIVLFQAEPKGKEDSATFEKLKEKLVASGIPEQEIAIKTANINQIKGIDLLSESCEIRYIITINALKEGWDCPFAYILATLANKTSKVDVEQILGRILRQPYASSCVNDFLNVSYVLTSSNDFYSTLDSIISGLKGAGFSKKDYRVIEMLKTNENNITTTTIEQISATGTIQNEELDFLNFNPDRIKQRIEITSEKEQGTTYVDHIFDLARQENREYINVLEQTNENRDFKVPSELVECTNGISVRDEFKDDIKKIEIPQFVIQHYSLFGKEVVLLENSHLVEGFSLKNKDTEIDFGNINLEARKVDIVEGKDNPEAKQLQRHEIESIKAYFSGVSTEELPNRCANIIMRQLEKINDISETELKQYVLRIMNNLSKDHLNNIGTDFVKYANKIKDKIITLQNEYKSVQFKNKLEQDVIYVEPKYQLPTQINPQSTLSIEKSLYKEEESVGVFERDMIDKITAQNNVEWWHRNRERGKGFYINGFINHYPDFIVRTKKGNIILIETKGVHLENEDSKQKVELGKAWQNKAGGMFKYYMVFKDKPLQIKDAHGLDEFIELFKGL